MSPAFQEEEFSWVGSSASSHLTLMVIGIIALIGLSLVLGYTALVYSKFKSRVTATQTQGYGNE